MIKLIDKKTSLEYFGAPGPGELATWCRENGYHGVDPAADRGDDLPSDYVLAAALWHARTRYPEAGNLDVCSYAGLVAYLATGWYGGFGTESYEKERQAEHIVLALAGGRPPAPDGIVALVPEEVVTGTPSADWTRRVIAFLDAFYFGDPEEAVARLLGDADDRTAARVVLALARTKAEYERLARVAEGFLKKKENISALRRAVREVLKK